MSFNNEDYLGFVRSIARNFENTPRCDHEDYVNIGLLALEKATSKFDPNKETKFTTFALPFVKRAMAKEFQATKNMLAGITPHKYKNNTDVKELADRTNNHTLSLNANYKEDTNLADIVASGAFGPEETACQNEIGKHIKEIIESLPDIYRDIVRMRLVDGEIFEHIAQVKNTTKNTVAGRYAKALILIQAEATKRGLSQYLEDY